MPLRMRMMSFDNSHSTSIPLLTTGNVSLSTLVQSWSEQQRLSRRRQVEMYLVRSQLIIIRIITWITFGLYEFFPYSFSAFELPIHLSTKTLLIR